jgi:hypothetical protein
VRRSSDRTLEQIADPVLEDSVGRQALAGQVGREVRFSGAASHCASKRPIWLGEAALP